MGNAKSSTAICSKCPSDGQQEAEQRQRRGKLENNVTIRLSLTEVI